MSASPILNDRKGQVKTLSEAPFALDCERKSTAGSVSQRACVFCGSRVVLYPVADALHLIHGSIGCAAYTWDIRGALSSGPELHRLSFCTDLREGEVVFGGEEKLYRSLDVLIDRHKPQAAFVYATCIVGVIGDDVEAVCRRVEREKGIPVIPVHSEGFKGSKKEGYKAACRALETLVGTGDITGISPASINILGEFNLAGEAWMIKDYYKKMGVEVVSVLTGDGRIADIRRAHGATLNVVQCSGSLTYLAEAMKEKYGIPYIRVSYFGMEDTARSLYDVADFLVDKDPELPRKAAEVVREETARVYPQLKEFATKLKGKKAAIYVGGAFKAFSLVKILRYLGMEISLVGSQTGNAADYKQLAEMCDPGTVIVDDSNPLELAHFVKEKGVDLFIGGVKERPIAYKIGVGFCDHNHERKIPLAGFEGMLHFAKEVTSSVMSPVWKWVPGKGGRK